MVRYWRIDFNVGGTPVQDRVIFGRNAVSVSGRAKDMAVEGVVEGIHHVSINVRDVAAAEGFYVDVLGMESLDRPDFGFAGAWLRAGEQEVHLMQVDSAPPPKEQHFAFRVKDVSALRERVERAGFECSDTQEIPGVCRQAFTRDPSGNLVEFNQRL